MNNERNPVWQFFDRKVCLTTSPLLWECAKDRMDIAGLTDVQPFYAVRGKDSFNSFNRSEKAIIEDFLQSGAWHLLHLEDDVYLKGYNHLAAAIAQLPPHWDILYLGANLCGPGNWPAPNQFSTHLYRVKHAWTTHAVAYRRKVAEYIAMDYDPDKDGMFDDYLTRRVLHKFDAYVVSPMVAWQQRRHSELWGRHVDYEGNYSQSQSRMI